MRTTIALDDELLAKAQAYTGLTTKSALVTEALKALIERESARRLARLGGSEPQTGDIATAAATARVVRIGAVGQRISGRPGRAQKTPRQCHRAPSFAQIKELC